jgi:hypothetical protein
LYNLSLTVRQPDTEKDRKISKTLAVDMPESSESEPEDFDPDLEPEELLEESAREMESDGEEEDGRMYWIDQRHRKRSVAGHRGSDGRGKSENSEHEHRAESEDRFSEYD